MSTLELENIKHPDNAGNNIALASNGSIIVDRRSTDGTIAEFRKDGTAVGSIEVEGGDITIDGGSEHTGLRFEATQITPRHNGAYSNNYTGLGTASNRFKDLYLGDGVYLGGTGSANKLDDYEEGTWTPAWVPAAGSITNYWPTGFYQKSGSFVHAMGYWGFGSAAGVSAGDKIQLGGLPFVSASSTFGQSQAGTVSLHAHYGWSSAANQPYPTAVIYAGGNTTFSIFSSDLFANTNPAAYEITFSDMGQGGNHSQIVAHIFYRTV